MIDIKRIIKATATGAFIGAAIFVSSANATIATRDAKIHIYEPIQIIVGTDMDFGKVAKPSSGAATVVLDTLGSRSGTATLLPGSAHGAEYTITGNTGDTVNITLTDAGGASGLALTNFTALYGTTSFTDTASALSGPGLGTNLKVGATMTVDPTVANGALTRSYTIEVNYD